MKYYVYAGYYENFISGHKLPKPYTLRDEFKTFNEALDYVWENWEDDAIFFTEDVIGDAIDNGFIDDENWENYLIKESADDNWYKLKMLNEMLDAMEEDEYNIPKLGIYGVTKNINLDEGAIRALIKYYK